MNVQEIIKENQRRRELIKKPYNPVSGEGCNGERAQIYIEDAPCPYLWLPKEMINEPLVKAFKKHKSIRGVIEAFKLECTKDNHLQTWIMLCEVRYRYDFEYFAITCATIQDKISGNQIRFKLNRGQRRLIATLEKMRLAGIPIRIILLKARQWGGSTCIQMYMSWIQMVHKENWSSVICAHLKDASINIRSMFDKVIKNMLPIDGVHFTIKNFQNTQNIKEVPERGCRITVGSAEEPDSVRSQDAKLAHFSEIAFYPNTEKKKTDDLITSIVGSIPRVPMTLVAYESTANGVGDTFYNEWEKAKKGETAFEPVFVPWYLIDMYSEDFDGRYVNHKGKKVAGGEEDIVRTLSEYEKNLFLNHKECRLENINWYRGKLAEMTSHSKMKQEYPSDDIEAFQDSGMPVFRSEDVERNRKSCELPMAIGDIASDCTPSIAKVHPERRKEVLMNVRFIEDETALEGYNTSDNKTRYIKSRNKLKIWDYPEYEKVTNRYVVSVDTGGRSEKADFSVIRVFDNYLRMYGGMPKVVASWNGHVDHDILVWLAAQIATYYNKALLVFESNTHETEKRDGDQTEFIFDTIAEYYSSLYSRTPADKILEGMPAKWGFQTNRSTKPMIISNYTAILRDGLYEEKEEEALNEARVYEQKKNGEYGAKQGMHDDILMATMIGLYICYDLPVPKRIEENRTTVKKVRTAASI